MINILCIETGTDTCSVALAAGEAGAYEGAFEGAFDEGGAAVGRLVALRESHGERDHAARAAVYVREVLDEAGVAPTAISAVAVSRGPGSYTGLRIGVSLAKGLCYGLGVPLIGVGSLDSLCRVAMEGIEKNNYHPAALIPMIDARRMEVYGQVFDARGEALTGPEAWVIDENSLSEWRGGGPGKERAKAGAGECRPVRIGAVSERSVVQDDRIGRNRAEAEHKGGGSEGGADGGGTGEVAIFGSGAEKCRQTLPWTRFIDVRPSARGMIRLAFRAFRAGEFEDVAYFEPLYLKDFLIKTSTKKLF